MKEGTVAMKRILALAVVLVLVLAAGRALAADEGGFLAPDSEEAGWLWPAAFGINVVRIPVVDFPVTYLIDSPRIVLDLIGRRDAETLEELVTTLKDPFITVKDPVAAELRRRTGQDFGYSDSASSLERNKSASQWAKWVRENKSP